MRNVGIMGGTFDPVHNGHIQVAKCAKEQYHLNEIWFMPSKIPPHKRTQKISSEKDRMQMVCLAIDGIPGFVASDFELHRSEITYTAHTMRLLKEKYPNTAFSFIMGGDSFFQFENWFHPEEIVKYTKILATGRDGVSKEAMLQRKRELTKKFHGEFELIDMEDFIVSSSSIREMIKNGEAVDSLLPAKVADYIKLHNLYTE